MARKAKKTVRKRPVNKPTETQIALPLNKLISNRDKAREQAKRLSAVGLTEQAEEASKRAEEWQAEIDRR